MAVTETTGGGATGLRFLFRALRHRNYKLFFAGQGVSVIGTWMQGAAQGWLIRTLVTDPRDASFWLGMVPFVSQLPTFLLPLLTGVLADRLNRRKILLVTQTLSMLQALALSALVFSNVVTIWQIILLALSLGLINSFDIPARQSFVVEMIEDRSDLGNAIALNSSLVNFARIIGPALAGLLIAFFGRNGDDLNKTGIAFCYLCNGISYLFVLRALLAMTVKPRVAVSSQGHVLAGLKEGFKYAAHSKPIRAVLLLLATISVMGVAYSALMPTIARDILHVGADQYGLLFGAVGVGALGGAASLAGRKNIRGLKTVVATGAIAFGCGLVAFSFSTNYWVACGLLVVTGFGWMTTSAACNTFLQTIVDDDKRGRVMSFWAMSFMGMVPFGSLYTSLVAHAIGPMHTVLIGGLMCILAGVVFASRLPMLRRLTYPIYVRKGLVPPPEGKEPS